MTKIRLSSFSREARLMARMTTLPAPAGVKRPVVLIEPALASQRTFVLALPTTAAVNCCFWSCF